jgi:peptidoglycan hydrolase-like protein with peptidoglycan-binding domain
VASGNVGGEIMVAKGSPGEHVEHLQRLLKVAGVYPGSIDGVFGPETEAAVRAYQQKAGLPVDGIAGPNTMAALKKTHEERKEARAERKEARAERQAERPAAQKPVTPKPVVPKPTGGPR